MRLRAGLGLLCLTLAGCQHVPEGVKVDLQNRVVEVGPCRCRLPAPGEAKPEVQAPVTEPAPPVPPVGDEPQ